MEKCQIFLEIVQISFVDFIFSIVSLMRSLASNRGRSCSLVAGTASLSRARRASHLCVQFSTLLHRTSASAQEVPMKKPNMHYGTIDENI